MTLLKQPLPSAKSAQKRQTILLSVAGHLVSQGFSNSGIRALAKSAGISDRMLLYYFETKEALLDEALSLLFNEFSSHLDTILPQARASSTEIVAALVASSTTDASRPMLALWFEIVGLAMRGDEPLRQRPRSSLMSGSDGSRTNLRRLRDTVRESCSPKLKGL